MLQAMGSWAANEVKYSVSFEHSRLRLFLVNVLPFIAVITKQFAAAYIEKMPTPHESKEKAPLNHSCNADGFHVGQRHWYSKYQIFILAQYVTQC